MVKIFQIGKKIPPIYLWGWGISEVFFLSMAPKNLNLIDVI